MKKILFALAIMPLLFAACSKDDAPSNKEFDHNIELLYGQWRATAVKVDGVTIDLTDATTELKVVPTHLTFSKDGSVSGEGILGEGTGKYTAKGNIINTNIGKDKFDFDVISLSPATAEVKVNAGKLGISIIPEGTENVVVVLTKDYVSKNKFDHDIEMLYGEWRATNLEMKGVNTDLTHPAVKPTNITFEKKGVYSTKGFLGEGKGRFNAKDNKILTLIGDKFYDYEMTELDATTTKIKLNPQDVDFGFAIDKDVKTAVVTLKKQPKK